MERVSGIPFFFFKPLYEVSYTYLHILLDSGAPTRYFHPWMFPTSVFLHRHRAGVSYPIILLSFDQGLDCRLWRHMQTLTRDGGPQHPGSPCARPSDFEQVT